MTWPDKDDEGGTVPRFFACPQNNNKRSDLTLSEKNEKLVACYLTDFYKVHLFLCKISLNFACFSGAHLCKKDFVTKEIWTFEIKISDFHFSFPSFSPIPSFRVFHIGTREHKIEIPLKKEGFHPTESSSPYQNADLLKKGLILCATRVEKYILSVENWIDDKAPLVFCIFEAIPCDKWSHAILLPFFAPSFRYKSRFSYFSSSWTRLERGKEIPQ